MKTPNSSVFDNFGIKPPISSYRKDLNVMGEILLSHYEPTSTPSTKLKTQATTNLNAEEPEEPYGNRVCRRIRELFN